MPFPGGDAFPDPSGRQLGIFHIHVGMAGYGVYAITGSQTIIGIVMEHGTYYSQVEWN